MKPAGVLRLTCLLLASSALAVHFAPGQTAPPPPAQAQAVMDGKYLVTAGDCVACHTAKGGVPFAGGTVIHTPFGKLIGPNITPDRQNGIGGWTDQQFVEAVKYGYGHNVGHLYPGLPYVYFNKVPVPDILKIRAYLNSIPASDNQITANHLPFPFHIRLLMIGWNLLFFPDHGDFRTDPAKSAEWNRGAYLVQGLGHCAACHTPKNVFGGDHTNAEFTGYVIENANAPELLNEPNIGLGTWSADDIATYLKTGHNAYADAGGPMSSVITHSTSQLTMADDHAIATYLKSLPGSGNPQPAPIAASDAAMIAGSHVYADECSACHTSAGAGLPNLIPALKSSPVVNASDPATLLHVVLNGGRSVATDAAPTAGMMPAFHGILTDQQVADVLTYIRNNWGNAAPAVSAGQIADAR